MTTNKHSTEHSFKYLDDQRKCAYISWSKFMNSAAALFMSLMLLIPHHFVEFHLFRGMPPTRASCKYTFWKALQRALVDLRSKSGMSFSFQILGHFHISKGTFQTWNVWCMCKVEYLSRKLWRLLETGAYFNQNWNSWNWNKLKS